MSVWRPAQLMLTLAVVLGLEAPAAAQEPPAPPIGKFPITDPMLAEIVSRAIGSIKFNDDRTTVEAGKNARAELFVGKKHIQSENGVLRHSSDGDGDKRDGVHVGGEEHRVGRSEKSFVYSRGDGAYSCVEIMHMGREPLCK